MDILDFINIRTIQSPQSYLMALSDETRLERKLNEKGIIDQNLTSGVRALKN
jgi:hypothetical protein